MIILGSAMFERSDAASVYSEANQLAEKLRLAASKDYSDWRVFNVLHRVRISILPYHVFICLMTI